jgi:hypothetical protein
MTTQRSTNSDREGPSLKTGFPRENSPAAGSPAENPIPQGNRNPVSAQAIATMKVMAIVFL